jgi:hypothetical protein
MSSANAGVVLFDDFNSGAATLNWSGDSLFAPAVGSVDLVGPGSFQRLASTPTGNSVDLDGSTGTAGTLQSIGAFGPGKYTLSFLLAGNMRGDVNKTTTISLGDWSTPLDLPASSPYTLYTYTFTTTGGKLSFADNGAGNKDIGNLLDNVSLATAAGTVGDAAPELSTWMMLLLGFAGLSFVGYRASRVKTAFAA